MATIKELIKAEETGGLSFGNYDLKEKTKQYINPSLTLGASLM